MFERFTNEAARTLSVACVIANSAQRNLVDVPDLAAGALIALEAVQKSDMAVRARQIVLATLGIQRPEEIQSGQAPDVAFNDSVRRILKCSVDIADRLGHHRIRPEHLLLAIFEEGCVAVVKSLQVAELSPEALAGSAARAAALEDTPFPFSAHLKLG
jgi:ATP-dependent Clp protease ATP-binding subunit ClpA